MIYVIWHDERQLSGYIMHFTYVVYVDVFHGDNWMHYSGNFMVCLLFQSIFDLTLKGWLNPNKTPDFMRLSRIR